MRLEKVVMTKENKVKRCSVGSEEIGPLDCQRLVVVKSRKSLTYRRG